MKADTVHICQLCGRRVPQSVITAHHLIPRERGGKAEHAVPLCRPCHGHIHAVYDNKTLAANFGSLQSLRRDPRIQRFVKFIRKQDPAARFRSAMSNGHPKRNRRRS